MKTNTIGALSTLCLAGATALGAPHDLQYINILGSGELIMMSNTGDEPISLDGWRFCTQNSTSGPIMSHPHALDGIAVAPHSSFVIRYNNNALPGFPTHHNASDIGPLAPFELDAYAISLFAPDAQGDVDFADATLMTDHVQWKRNLVDDSFAAQCSSVAMDAGLWVEASEWIYVRMDTYLVELTDRDNGQLHSPDDYNVIFECRADLTDDGVLDFFDVSAFLAAFVAMDPAADASQDGNFTFFDVSIFLQQFAAGCP